ncbi:MAG: hypothetical protein Q8O90_11815 [Elusimicrobiota bacterium]|nr:hypothetical protein [Elusimicrobiota bacterium]
METTEELNIRISFNRKSARLLLVVFFLCWHPGFIGSESLTLTTYYPAPYGGYVSILTTGNTILARDGGVNTRVAVGSGSPTSKLHVFGGGSTTVDMIVNGRMQTGDGNGNGGVWLSNAQDGFVGNTTIGNAGGNGVGLWVNGASGSGWGLLVSKANRNVGINTVNPSEKLHVANGNIRIENGNLNIGGDGNSTGFITGICRPVAYTLNAGGTCLSAGFGYRVMATYSSPGGSCATGGMIFRGGVLQDPNRWIPLTVQGCSGTMLCCRIRDW